MSLGLIGRKLGMTQIFDESGIAIPVTVVEAGPCYILENKNSDKFGYNSLKICFWEKSKNVTKPIEGYYKKLNIKPHKYIKEFRLKECNSDYKSGDVLDVTLFQKGERVLIKGKTIGKGFQGVIKRHGLHGGKMTHGSRFHRAPGSIGQCADPSKVFKGVKLPGRTGGKFSTVRNLEIVDIVSDDNVLLVKGAIPGSNDSIIYIKKI